MKNSRMLVAPAIAASRVAVSMPSRPIIRSVNRNTPQKAVPPPAVEASMCSRMCCAMCLPWRIMCTVQPSTSTIARSASTPSQNGVIAPIFASTMPSKIEAPTATTVPARSARIRSGLPVLRRYSAVMAMMRKASTPSRNVTIMVENMEIPLG